MYDELVKRLRNRRICIQQLGTLNDYPLLGEAADAIEELTGFVQEAERDRNEYRERLDKANDAIEELSKKYLASEVDNTNLTGWLAEEHAKHLWIPVTERLPKEEETVLAFGTLGVAWLDWRHDNKWCCYGGVTHWMPLPEPPKEE